MKQEMAVQPTSWHPVLGICIERVLDALHAAQYSRIHQLSQTSNYAAQTC